MAFLVKGSLTLAAAGHLVCWKPTCPPFPLLADHAHSCQQGEPTEGIGPFLACGMVLGFVVFVSVAAGGSGAVLVAAPSQRYAGVSGW